MLPRKQRYKVHGEGPQLPVGADLDEHAHHLDGLAGLEGGALVRAGRRHDVRLSLVAPGTPTNEKVDAALVSAGLMN